VGGAPTARNDSYTSNVATLLSVSAGSGVLTNDFDPSGHPLTASPVGGTVGTPFTIGSLTVTLNANGSFIAQAGVPGTFTFQYNAVNSQGTSSATPGTVTLVFPTASNLEREGGGRDQRDPDPGLQVGHRAGPDLQGRPELPVEQRSRRRCAPGLPQHPVRRSPTLGTNFHTAYMPVIAAGCTGVQSCERGQSVYDNNPASTTYQQHVPAVCISGICTASSAGQCRHRCRARFTWWRSSPMGHPGQYYISILPGDISNPFNVGYQGPVGTTPLWQLPDAEFELADNRHRAAGCPVRTHDRRHAVAPVCTARNATTQACTTYAYPTVANGLARSSVNVQPNRADRDH